MNSQSFDYYVSRCVQLETAIKWLIVWEQAKLILHMKGEKCPRVNKKYTKALDRLYRLVKY